MKLTFPALLLSLAPTLCLAATPRHVTDPGAPRAVEVDGVVTVQWGDPPRITLSWQLIDAHGQAQDSGRQVLQDPGFLHGGLSLRNRNDALRYEKLLIDRWLQQVLSAPARTAGR